jgi:hypothetical protein
MQSSTLSVRGLTGFNAAHAAGEHVAQPSVAAQVDPTLRSGELSEADLEHVVGGLARTWLGLGMDDGGVGSAALPSQE